MLLMIHSSAWLVTPYQLCHLLLLQLCPGQAQVQLGSVLLTLSHVKCQRTVRGDWLTLLFSMKIPFHATILIVGRHFVHHIHLSDSRPFRILYRRVPPGQYHKLHQVLDMMKEREIIRKSTSEYASLLVLVWKKNGDLRICRFSLVEQEDP